MTLLTEKSKFGKTGLEVPPVIFGTSALGNLYEAIPDATKEEIVGNSLKFVDNPVVFDIAGKYGAGLALEELGRCLRFFNVKKENVIISNKLGWIRTELKTPEPTFEPGAWMNLKHDAVQKISYDGILECWEQGNQLLGGEYIPQLVSVHDPDEYIANGSDAIEKEKLFNDVLDAYRALADLRAKGEVKAVGVGSKDWKVIQRISREIKLDWVMFANSFTIYNHPQDLLDFIDELTVAGVGIVNSAVFHAGFLVGGKFFDYKVIQPDTPENKRIFQWRDTFMVICKKYNVSPAVACIQFGLTPPGVNSIALNTSNPDNVLRNVESVMVDIPSAFWQEMKEQGLIQSNYPYLK